MPSLFRRYSQTARGKREIFRNRKLTMLRKAYELESRCGASVLVVIQRNSTLCVYNSFKEVDGGKLGPAEIPLHSVIANISSQQRIVGPQDFINNELQIPASDDNKSNEDLEDSQDRDMRSSSIESLDLGTPLLDSAKSTVLMVPPPPVLSLSPTVKTEPWDFGLL